MKLRLRGKFWALQAAKRSSYPDFSTPCLQSIVHFYVNLYIRNDFLIGRKDSGQLKLPFYDLHVLNLFSNYSTDILKINLALKKFIATSEISEN